MSTSRRKLSTKRADAAKRRKARLRANVRRRAAEHREKRHARSASVTHRQPVSPENIHLVRGKGGRTTGGGKGGFYWHIYVDSERVGHVYINIIDEPPFGRHPSIQIFLNKDQRGRRIGRVAYRLACEKSNLDEVFAHMRKSNVGSKRAAEEAGFIVIANDLIAQCAMVWRRVP